MSNSVCMLPVRVFSSFTPITKQPSLIGKNVLRAYGKSTLTTRRIERRLAVLLSFLLCFLHYICLLYMRFHCQIGILALENSQNSVYSRKRLYILPVRKSVTWCDLCFRGWHE